jgi:hypothetical protein
MATAPFLRDHPHRHRSASQLTGGSSDSLAIVGPRFSKISRSRLTTAAEIGSWPLMAFATCPCDTPIIFPSWR